MLSANQTTSAIQHPLVITNEINVTAHMVDTNEDFNPFASMEQLTQWFRLQTTLTNHSN
jgi:hypothetical protein